MGTERGKRAQPNLDSIIAPTTVRCRSCSTNSAAMASRRVSSAAISAATRARSIRSSTRCRACCTCRHRASAARSPAISSASRCRSTSSRAPAARPSSPSSANSCSCRRCASTSTALPDAIDGLALGPARPPRQRRAAPDARAPRRRTGRSTRWRAKSACRARPSPNASPKSMGAPPMHYLANWRLQLRRAPAGAPGRQHRPGRRRSRLRIRSRLQPRLQEAGRRAARRLAARPPAAARHAPAAGVSATKRRATSRAAHSVPRAAAFAACRTGSAQALDQRGVLVPQPLRQALAELLVVAAESGRLLPPTRRDRRRAACRSPRR